MSLRETVSRDWDGILVFSLVFLALLWRAPPLEFYLGSADHGYQLALGRQVLLGKFPFIDLFFHYGPLTAFTSAFGIWASGSLVGETLICALGYALAILLLQRIARFHFGSLPATLIALPAFLFLARFYKWYYWLFPILSLYLLQLNDSNASSRTALAWAAGLSSGLAWLYRFDLGLATLAVVALSMIGFGLADENAGSLHPKLTGLLAGFTIPVGLWIAVLATLGGAPSIRDYVVSTWEGTLGAVEGMSTPVPGFDWSSPFAESSMTALLYWLVPSTHVVCLGTNRRGAAVSGLLGLAILPQALHRAEIQHLLQVIPPFFLTSVLVFRWLWKRRPRHSHPLAVFYLLTVVVALARTSSQAAPDLGPWVRNPAWAYSSLHRGLEARTTHSNAPLMRAVQEYAGPGEPILVADVVTSSQFYYFAERRMSGTLVVLAPGVLDGDVWRRREMAHIEEDPPAVVIARADAFADESSPVRLRQPEIYQWVSSRYTRVLYDSAGWMILAAAEPSGLQGRSPPSR